MAVRRPSISLLLVVAVCWTPIGCRAGDELRSASAPTNSATRSTESGAEAGDGARAENAEPPACAAHQPGADIGSGARASTVGATVVSAPDHTMVESVLERWIDRVQAFGGVVGIRVPGDDDVIVAAGVDDRLPDTPMPPGGRFQIASITKTFVTALVMQLIDQGELRLDSSIDHWFPDIENADRITICMLLAHRSGLADFARDRPDEYRTTMLADLELVYSPRETIALSTALPARFEPGTGYASANTNFQILGEIAAEVTGTPIAELIDQRLLAPLDLTATSLDGEAPVEPDEHHGWFTLDPAIGDLEAGTFDPTVPRDLDILDFSRAAVLTQIGAAGGMRSDLGDLLTWGEALYCGDVLSPESLAALLVSTNRSGETDDDHPSLHYGLGTMVVCPCEPRPRLVGHDGSLVGGRSLLVAVPDTATIIVIHANVQEIALRDLFALADELDTLTRGPHPVRQSGAAP